MFGFLRWHKTPANDPYILQSNTCFSQNKFIRCMFILIHLDYDRALVPLQISLQISWHQCCLRPGTPVRRPAPFSKGACRHSLMNVNIWKTSFSLVAIISFLIALQSNTTELEINLLPLCSTLPPSLSLRRNFLMWVDFASQNGIHFLPAFPSNWNTTVKQMSRVHKL